MATFGEVFGQMIETLTQNVQKARQGIETIATKNAFMEKRMMEQQYLMHELLRML